MPKQPSVIYFLVNDHGECKIGFAQDAARRLNEHKSSYAGWQFYAAICGSMTNEKEVQRFFLNRGLGINGSDEQFRIDGALKEYLEWLGTRAFAACTIEDISDVYPHPNRFPWQHQYGIADGKQESLLLDQIVPNLRKPQTRSARILSTIRSDSDEWYTPPIYTRAAREVMGGIDLDPASSALANLTVRAASIFTAADDGLRYEWFGRVWMNPPYGNEKDKFVEHLIGEYNAGRVTAAIMCLNAHATDTVWFQQLWKYPICFTNHRPRFIGGQHDKKAEDVQATTGIVFVYVGDAPQKFADIFSAFGPIVECTTPAKKTAQENRRRISQGKDWADVA